MGWHVYASGKWHLSWICDVCNRSLSEVRPAPLLRDKIWRRMADKSEVLCELCARQRAKHRLGRDITVTDRAPKGSIIAWWEPPGGWAWWEPPGGRPDTPRGLDASSPD
jgi:hypothetical protein